MIIDFHTHAFPDALAPKAIPLLAERASIEPETDGTVSSLISRMDEWRIDRAVVCNIATNPRQMDNVNRFADETNLLHGDRLTALWSVHPDAPTSLETLERAKSAGVPGIKLHPDYMGYDFDHPVYDPILDFCEQLGLFVIIHAGFDVLSPEHVHATAPMIRKRLSEYPHLDLVAAHFGNNRYWADAERDLVGSNVYFDTSLGCVYDLPADAARRMILAHDEGHVLFGTDCPWSTGDSALRYLESLRLPSDRMDAILSGNAARLLHL